MAEASVGATSAELAKPTSADSAPVLVLLHKAGHLFASMRAFGALLGLGAALWLNQHWVIFSPIHFSCLWLVKGLNCCLSNRTPVGFRAAK